MKKDFLNHTFFTCKTALLTSGQFNTFPVVFHWRKWALDDLHPKEKWLLTGSGEWDVRWFCLHNALSAVFPCRGWMIGEFVREKLIPREKFLLVENGMSDDFHWEAIFCYVIFLHKNIYLFFQNFNIFFISIELIKNIYKT